MPSGARSQAAGETRASLVFSLARLPVVRARVVPVIARLTASLTWLGEHRGPPPRARGQSKTGHGSITGWRVCVRGSIAIVRSINAGLWTKRGVARRRRERLEAVSWADDDAARAAAVGALSDRDRDRLRRAIAEHDGDRTTAHDGADRARSRAAAARARARTCRRHVDDATRR
jgi:hypothetical protein